MPDSRALAYSGIYHPTQVVWSWNLRSQSPEAAPPPGVKRTSSHCSLTSFPAPLHTRACRTGKQALPVPSTLPPLLQIVPLLNSAQREWACSFWAAETRTDERAMRRKKHPEPRPYDKGSAKAAGSKARTVICGLEQTRLLPEQVFVYCKQESLISLELSHTGFHWCFPFPRMTEVTDPLLRLHGDPLPLRPQKEADSRSEGRASTASTPSFPLSKPASLQEQWCGVLVTLTKAKC